jgi:hypothetical protein
MTRGIVAATTVSWRPWHENVRRHDFLRSASMPDHYLQRRSLRKEVVARDRPVQVHRRILPTQACRFCRRRAPSRKPRRDQTRPGRTAYPTPRSRAASSRGYRIALHPNDVDRADTFAPRVTAQPRRRTNNSLDRMGGAAPRRVVPGRPRHRRCPSPPSRRLSHSSGEGGMQDRLPRRPRLWRWPRCPVPTPQRSAQRQATRPGRQPAAASRCWVPGDTKTAHARQQLHSPTRLSGPMCCRLPGREGQRQH